MVLSLTRTDRAIRSRAQSLNHHTFCSYRTELCVCPCICMHVSMHVCDQRGLNCSLFFPAPCTPWLYVGARCSESSSLKSPGILNIPCHHFLSNLISFQFSCREGTRLHWLSRASSMVSSCLLPTGRNRQRSGGTPPLSIYFFLYLPESQPRFWGLVLFTGLSQ